MDTIDRQLRYFVKIAEAGSLSRAAEELGCTQSILSRQLSALEKEVGRTLFGRTGRGVELTDAGRKLFTVVAPAFLAIDDVVTSVQSDQMGGGGGARWRVHRPRTAPPAGPARGSRHGGTAPRPPTVQGTLTLATIHSLSYFFLGPLFRDFSRDYPSVKIRLLTRSSVETVELLEARRVDAGLVYDTAVVSPDLRSTPLFQSEMALIARCDSDLPTEVNLRELELKLVVFPQNHALRRMLTSSKVSFKIAAEADTYDAMLDMASFGVGNCILPNRIPDGYLASRGLRKVKIAEPPLSRQVAFVVHAESSKAPMLKRLEAAVLREARSLLAANTS